MAIGQLAEIDSDVTGVEWFLFQLKQSKLVYISLAFEVTNSPTDEVGAT